MDTEPGIADPVLAAAVGVRRAMLVPVVTALAIGTIFVAVYLAAFHAPAAHHQPLGIVGTAQAAGRTEAALEEVAPGAYAFHRFPDAASARDALEHAVVPGALMNQDGQMVLLAAGAHGPSTLSALQADASRAAGHRIPVQDVVPLVPGDTRGLSVFYASFGVVLAGFLFSVASYQIAPRMRLSARVASMAIFAAASGAVVALVAHSLLKAVPGAFTTVAAVVGLLAMASAAMAGVIIRVCGPLGMPVASAVLLIFGNATSGGILPPSFLPPWLEPLSVVMPPAAAVRALRNSGYFHSAQLGEALLLMVASILVCLAVQILLDLRSRRRSATP
ncbi:ABC transporter permease [Streptomyces sp. NPDC047023]|uniref:ABC transporter permease n=1 Tax=Streptomyces sp. NPDC047023 TaxID=3155139 RepID=UPI0033C7BED5